MKHHNPKDQKSCFYAEKCSQSSASMFPEQFPVRITWQNTVFLVKRIIDNNPYLCLSKEQTNLLYVCDPKFIIFEQVFYTMCPLCAVHCVQRFFFCYLPDHSTKGNKKMCFRLNENIERVSAGVVPTFYDRVIHSFGYLLMNSEKYKTISLPRPHTLAHALTHDMDIISIEIWSLQHTSIQ